MNELDMQEFSNRMAALSEEEQTIAVKYIEDRIMFAELLVRSEKRQGIISTIEEIMKGGKRDVC